MSLCVVATVYVHICTRKILRCVYLSTTHTESTLTVDNLTNLLEGMVHFGSVAILLDIPYSKYDTIIRQYNSDSQRKEAMWKYWLTHHPCPSWRIVADALYTGYEHEILDVLQKMYLKGE